MSKHKFHTKIKEYRAKTGLTQEKLADTVGARRETIIFLEQGKYVPSLKLAHDIAKVFGAAIEEVFFFTD
ncbi:MAG: helix-turn-helix transcriptional regulator [Candidatus Pacebacteria bacterium]|jgi:putative transcriptional regulator|nr:helix-turn-helix transcriptional regulator [Candidatus Paceibacterota bacterium]